MKKVLFVLVLMLVAVAVFGCQNKAPQVVPKEEVVVDDTAADSDVPASEDSNSLSSDSGTGAAVSDTTEEAIEEQTTDTAAEETSESASKTHTVEFTASGFEPEVLDVKVGDTVVWKNARTDSRNNLAMVVGGIGCQEVKSKMMKKGQSFSWTFTKPKTCTFIDGYYTTQTSKVVVAE